MLHNELLQRVRTLRSLDRFRCLARVRSLTKLERAPLAMLHRAPPLFTLHPTPSMLSASGCDPMFTGSADQAVVN